MTCMDIIKKLNPTDRAVCWKLFTELTRVFMFKHSKNTISLENLKESANQLNLIFEKNSYEPYFDLTVSDTVFIENLLAEMQKIKSQPKSSD